MLKLLTVPQHLPKVSLHIVLHSQLISPLSIGNQFFYFTGMSKDGVKEIKSEIGNVKDFIKRISKDVESVQSLFLMAFYPAKDQHLWPIL